MTMAVALDAHMCSSSSRLLRSVTCARPDCCATALWHERAAEAACRQGTPGGQAVLHTLHCIAICKLSPAFETCSVHVLSAGGTSCTLRRSRYTVGLAVSRLGDSPPEAQGTVGTCAFLSAKHSTSCRSRTALRER